jgi:hypothetical protein
MKKNGEGESADDAERRAIIRGITEGIDWSKWELAEDRGWLRRGLGKSIGVLGWVLFTGSGIALIMVGGVTLYPIIGFATGFAILLFPILMVAYPFIAWVFLDEPVRLVVGRFMLWGILWGSAFLGQVLIGLGRRVSSEED